MFIIRYETQLGEKGEVKREGKRAADRAVKELETLFHAHILSIRKEG